MCKHFCDVIDDEGVPPPPPSPPPHPTHTNPRARVLWWFGRLTHTMRLECNSRSAARETCQGQPRARACMLARGVQGRGGAAARRGGVRAARGGGAARRGRAPARGDAAPAHAVHGSAGELRCSWARQAPSQQSVKRHEGTGTSLSTMKKPCKLSGPARGPSSGRLVDTCPGPDCPACPFVHAQAAVATAQQSRDEAAAEAARRCGALETAAAGLEQRLTQQLVAREQDLLNQLGEPSKQTSQLALAWHGVIWGP